MFISAEVLVTCLLLLATWNRLQILTLLLQMLGTVADAYTFQLFRLAQLSPWPVFAAKF